MTHYKQQIILGVDKGFFSKLPNFLRNLIAFNRDNLYVYVLTNFEVKENDKAILKDLLEYDKLYLEFYHISNEERFNTEGVDYSNDSRSNSMSIRLYTNKLKLTGRALYLDLDILCTGNFSELFTENFSLDGKTIGAVADSYLMISNSLTKGKAFIKKLPHYLHQLPFNKKNQYFNSGVLLIDCDKLTKSNLWLKNIRKLDKTTSFPDQDFLNLIHFNDVKELGSRYNYLTFHLINNRYFYLNSKWFNKETNTPEYSTNIKECYYKKVKPIFLHFAGKEKQWNNSAKEFVKFYKIFNDKLSNILNNSPSYYTELINKLYQDYFYIDLLCDYQEDKYQELNIKELRQILKQEAWTFSPMLLNSKIFNPRTITSFLKNSITSKNRKVLNQKISNNKL